MEMFALMPSIVARAFTVVRIRTIIAYISVRSCPANTYYALTHCQINSNRLYLSQNVVILTSITYGSSYQVFIILELYDKLLVHGNQLSNYFTIL